MKIQGIHRPQFLLIPVLLLGVLPSLHAERVLPSPRFAAGSGIEMRITNFYEELPPYGFLPLRVEVKNASKVTRRWTLLAVHTQPVQRTMRSTSTLEVEPSSERTFDLLIPLAPQASGTHRYSHLNLVVTGYGVIDGVSNAHSSGGSRPPTPFTGMGGDLSVKSWGPLRELLEKKHTKSLDGTTINVNFLPTDWRGLAGFNILIFTAGEWRSIGAAEREAVQDWITQGGELILCHSEPTAPVDLPQAGARGAGSITHWVLGEDFVERTASLLAIPKQPLSSQALENYTWRWKLANAVGRAEVPQLLIIVFVIGFAVVIGPLNFVVLAPLGKRNRLFWTTPLISVGASACMAAFIFLSEGVGGSGQRIEAELSLPEERKTVIWQEQVSRTGVLLEGRFSLSEKALLLPLTLRDHTSGRRESRERNLLYSLNGSLWGGDWFQSRDTQGQFLAAVIPSRGKLEVQEEADGTPVAVSSFDKELQEVWYFDRAGEAWRGSNLKPGEKQALTEAQSDEHASWWKQAIQPAGPIIRTKAEDYAKGDKAGKFFAISSQMKAINSLPSIRWKETSGIIFGQTTP